MRITFLGTGTSHGIPVVGCNCPVCASESPKNKRHRSSVLLSWEGNNIVIDTPPEFRLAALANGLTGLDGVLYTHAHMDHIAGFDDIRRFSQLSGSYVNLFGNLETLKTIRKCFSYAFSRPKQVGGGLPRVKLHPVKKDWVLRGKQIIPLSAFHGKIPVLGFRIEKFAYLTDVKTIPDTTMTKMTGLDLLVLGVLRYRSHSTHLNLAEALTLVKTIKPKKTLFTHLAHDFDHEELASTLPPEIKPAWDGLTINIGAE